MGMESSTAASRSDYIFMAVMAQQAARYADMRRFVQEMVLRTSSLGDFMPEERKLIALSYRHVIGPRRSSWRKVVSLFEEVQKGRREEECAVLIKGFLDGIEAGIAEVCAEVLSLLGSHLIPSSSSSSESRVFFLKMKGDYHRYVAEVRVGEERKEASESAMKAYKEAEEIAVLHLAPSNITRLGLALNFSVFYHDILNSLETALLVADQAFYEAIEELEELDKEPCKDANIILSLLQDNFNEWKFEDARLHHV
ncbi:hypothetical protein HPP92_012711 [Vanilla planifolia]|uniref:14-3-3 domain-containing protein n=1 Tax=Vanilla planifolia TaxID=51239 RepID=A0A835R0I2_VANPL|nr:hypothetical protein HPP92_012711 [Vanilla planifolia]